MNEILPTLDGPEPSFDDLEALVPPPAVRRSSAYEYRGDDSGLDNAKPARDEVDLCKGWMKFHRLELVKSADKVRELVDRAIQVGRVALDTETQGLDTRIEYDKEGRPYTRHSIIGYCLGLEGEGYYIPVRHVPESKRAGSPNVDFVEQAEAQIVRLCLAAQPVLKEGSRDVLGAKEKDFETPPRVVIEFWHAKFDQEMLYPITGIDIWNPYSFEDGMLMVYALCSEDEQGLKENAKQRLPPVVDPATGEEHSYEMIEFKQLFAKGMAKADRKLEKLIPQPDGDGHNVVLYGCSDGICTNLLCKLLGPEVLKKKNLLSFYLLEKQVTQVVRIIERTRILINKGEIASLLQEAEEELLACENQIRKLAVAVGFPTDFNPSSSAQLADFLFGPKGIWHGRKPEKTGEGQYKTDEKTIELLAKEPNAPEAFNLIIKHRQINKVRGTYLQNLANNTDELDQLRLNFRATGAATGRFTAPKGDPGQGYAGVPIQGIPAKDDPKKPKVAHSLRRMFIARPRYVMVKVDYASQELRIAASMSGEQKWIAEYEKEARTGESADLHFLTAQAFYPGLTRDSPDLKLKRGKGKTGNFALIYGGGVGAVQRATGCDKVEGARMKQSFDESVPQFSKWVRRQKESVKRDRGVFTGFGRFIAIPDANVGRDEVLRRFRASAEKKFGKEKASQLTFAESEVSQEIRKVRSACERKATNFPIQGSGADILKISLVLLTREFHLRGWLKTGGDDSVRILMTVHDEIVFEVREERVAEAVPVIIKIMEHPYRIARWRIPLVAEAEIGPSWAATLNWAALLKGKIARPSYLEGVTIDPEPQVFVLVPSVGATGTPGSVEPSKPLAPVPSVAESSVVLSSPTASPSTLPMTPPVAPSVTPVAPPSNGSLVTVGKSTKVASIKLNTMYVDRETVCIIAEACAVAKIEAIRKNQLDQEMVVEFLLGGDDNVLLYSAKEGYRVHVKELEINLGRLNLFASCTIREEENA